MQQVVLGEPGSWESSSVQNLLIQSDHASLFDHSHIQNDPGFFALELLFSTSQLLALSSTYSPPHGSVHLQSSPPIRSHRAVMLIPSTSPEVLAASDYQLHICADFPSVTIISIYSLKHILWLKPLRTHSLTTADLINTSCWSE